MARLQYTKKHFMYRVFENKKVEAHAANGKVRIESYRDGIPIFLVSYDGNKTYDLNGKQKKSEADERWASNFGFGVIRHALDPGYQVEKLQDTVIREKDCYQIKIFDPKKKQTQFAINKSNFQIINVAFDTPRGWHERVYSNYFTKEPYDWLQSGQVELYYDNIKSNEVFWTDFDINLDLPDSLFILN